MKKNLRCSSALTLYGIILIFVLTGFENMYGSNLDWITQHITFPDLFRKNFYETGQLIPEFVFNIGAGQNVFSLTYYGFLSPIILLSYLFPFVDMTTYIMVVSGILYIISGNLAFTFLKKHFDIKKAFIGALMFMSVSPINFHFHRQIMFVWYLPFLLLALMGIDRYFDKGKKGLFLTSSVLIIFTNYYYSVSSLVCLFVYAVYRALQEENFELKLFIKRILKLIYLFVLPVMTSMVILLPTAYALVSNGRNYEMMIPLKELFIPRLNQVYYLHYGTIITEFLALAALGNAFCKKNSVSNIFFNIVLVLSSYSPLVRYFLNGLLYTREKALIPFVILFIYAFCLFVEKIEKDEIDYKKTLKVIIAIAIVFALGNFVNVYTCASLVGTIIILYFLRKHTNIICACVMIMLILIMLNGNTFENYVSKDEYQKLYLDEIEYLSEKGEDDFYRTQVWHGNFILGNRVFGENFNSTSIYSSTSNPLYRKFYVSYMGNNEYSRNCFVLSGEENELFSDFMGVRYVISENDPGFYYEKVAQADHLSLYKNSSAHPVFYVSSDKIGEEDFDKLEFPYTAEYLMTHTVVNEDAQTEYESVIEKYDVETTSYEFELDEEKTYSITLDDCFRNKILYLSFEVCNDGDYRNEDDLDITINGKKNVLTDKGWFYYNGNTRFDYVLPMENTQLLEVSVMPGKYKIQNLRMYTSDKISGEYESVENAVIDESSEKISCTATAEKGDYLVTSIPYGKGFSATVNGKSVNIEVVNKAFVGIKLEEGKNNIVIKYESPLFRVGAILGILGLLLLSYELVKDKIKVRKIK